MRTSPLVLPFDESASRPAAVPAPLGAKVQRYPKCSRQGPFGGSVSDAGSGARGRRRGSQPSGVVHRRGGCMLMAPPAQSGRGEDEEDGAHEQGHREGADEEAVLDLGRRQKGRHVGPQGHLDVEQAEGE